MTKADRPIGIFDSGIGGLTVFAEIRKRLPDESLIYMGDNARVPYGTKSAETVIRYSLENAAFLAQRDVKAIVVACNTASSVALPALSEKFDLPILGVVLPGVRPDAIRRRPVRRHRPGAAMIGVCRGSVQACGAASARNCTPRASVRAPKGRSPA